MKIGVFEKHASENNTSHNIKAKTPRVIDFRKTTDSSGFNLSALTKNNHRIARMLLQRVSNPEPSGIDNMLSLRTPKAPLNGFPTDYSTFHNSCSPRSMNRTGQISSQSIKKKFKNFLRKVDSSANVVAFVKYFESTPDLHCIISKEQMNRLVCAFREFLEPLVIEKDVLSNLSTLMSEELLSIERAKPDEADIRNESIRTANFICMLLIYKLSFSCKASAHMLKDGLSAVIHSLKSQIESFHQLIETQRKKFEAQIKELTDARDELDIQTRLQEDEIAHLEARLKAAQDLVEVKGRKVRRKTERKRVDCPVNDTSISNEGSKANTKSDRASNKQTSKIGSDNTHTDKYLASNQRDPLTLRNNQPGPIMKTFRSETLTFENDNPPMAVVSKNDRGSLQSNVQKMRESNFEPHQSKNSLLQTINRIPGKDTNTIANLNKETKRTESSTGKIKKFIFNNNVYGSNERLSKNDLLNGLQKIDSFRRGAQFSQLIPASVRSRHTIMNDILMPHYDRMHSSLHKIQAKQSFLGFGESSVDQGITNKLFQHLANHKITESKGVQSSISGVNAGVQTDIKIPTIFFNEFMKNYPSFKKLLTELHFLKSLDLKRLLEGSIDSVVKLLNSPKVHVVKSNFSHGKPEKQEKQSTADIYNSKATYLEQILLRQCSGANNEQSFELPQSTQEFPISRVKVDTPKHGEDFYLKYIETQLTSALFSYIKNQTGGNFHEIFSKALILLEAQKLSTKKKLDRQKEITNVLKEIMIGPSKPLLKTIIGEDEIARVTSRRSSSQIQRQRHTQLQSHFAKKRSRSLNLNSCNHSFFSESLIQHTQSFMQRKSIIVSSSLKEEIETQFQQVKSFVTSAMKRSWYIKQTAFTGNLIKKHFLLNEYEWKEYQKSINGLIRYDDKTPNYFSKIITEHQKINLLSFFKVKYFHKIIQQTPHSVTHDYFKKQIIGNSLKDTLADHSFAFQNSAEDSALDFKLMVDACHAYENFVGFDLLMACDGAELISDFKYKVSFLSSMDVSIPTQYLLRMLFILYQSYHGIWKLKKQYPAFRKVQFVEIVYYHFRSVFHSKNIAQENFMLLLLLCHKNTQIFSVNLFNRFIGIAQPALSLEELDEYINILYGVRFEQITSVDFVQADIITKIISQHDALLIEREFAERVYEILKKKLRNRPQYTEQVMQRSKTNSLTIADKTYLNFDFIMLNYFSVRRAAIWQDVNLPSFVYKAFDVLHSGKMNYFNLKRVLQRIVRTQNDFWEKLDNRLQTMVSSSEKNVLLYASSLESSDPEIFLSAIKFEHLIVEFKDQISDVRIKEFIKNTELEMVSKEFEAKTGKFLTNLIVLRKALLNYLESSDKNNSRPISKRDQNYFSFLYGPLVYYINHLMYLQGQEIIGFLIFYRILKTEASDISNNSKQESFK